MRIAVIGSSCFSDYARLVREVPRLLNELSYAGTPDITYANVVQGSNVDDHYYPVEIVTGSAIGANMLIQQYAKETKMRIRVYRPAVLHHSNGAYNPRAISRCNEEIVHVSDALIAIWDGNSNGTRRIIQHAELCGIPVRIVTFPQSTADIR